MGKSRGRDNQRKSFVISEGQPLHRPLCLGSQEMRGSQYTIKYPLNSVITNLPNMHNEEPIYSCISIILIDSSIEVKVVFGISIFSAF